jgi:PhzF family phenazine biosynthesis protein
LKIPIYQVDAFANQLFSGNPAAVCPIKKDISENLMQSIAYENNLSETAFIDLSKEPFNIRWFTPTTEVDLCGHATIASAKVLFENYLEDTVNEITFDSNSGLLKAFKRDNLIYLDFPSDSYSEVIEKAFVEDLLGFVPNVLFKGSDDFLAVFDNENIIKNLKPNFLKISQINSRGLIASAPGDQVDFTSRCFYPQFGVNEDPVTGSAHTLMIPYWSKILGKDEMVARQLSKRGGILYCEHKEERVLIGGKTAIYMSGEINL